MKPYYEVSHIKLFKKDCRDMSELPDESVDLIVTDPPYQLSSTSRPRPDQSAEGSYGREVPFSRQQSRIKGFMGQEWDVLPPVEVWKESLRVLKLGAFAFIMTTTRQDSLCQILTDLTHAGFQMSFTSIYWAYASGFPKAQNIGKAVDKRLGTYKEGKPTANARFGYDGQDKHYNHAKITRDDAQSPQAKALDGSYGGFQPKPAVEVILVAMKPLSEKTFVDQALKNQKGITWLDDCRIPYESEGDKEGARFGTQMDIRGGNLKTPRGIKAKNVLSSQSGRFPANLLVSDDVLNDGRVRSSSQYPYRAKGVHPGHWGEDDGSETQGYTDSGSFSRYFDLDKWWAKTFPFLIVPKASKSEKNKGCEDLPPKVANPNYGSGGFSRPTEQPERKIKPRGNYHPTVKPVKLMAYLITLGSREGDVVLDNFGGSGTTAVAAQLLERRCIMYEIDEHYCEMAANRCRQMVLGL